jgi:hypothetical protein
MNFVIGTTSLDATATDLLAVGVKQGELAQALGTLDAAFGNKLSEALTAGGFGGRAGGGKGLPTFGPSRRSGSCSSGSAGDPGRSSRAARRGSARSRETKA